MNDTGWCQNVFNVHASGHDIRQALELSTATHHSAVLRGGAPVALPLADRVGDPLYPRWARPCRTRTLLWAQLGLCSATVTRVGASRPYRWSGGDAIGSVQSAADAVAGVTF